MPIDSKLQEHRCGDNEPKPFVPPPTRELIEVQFSENASSGVETWKFEEDNDYQGKKPSGAWPPGLRAILEENQLVSWEPSFPLRYRWSPDCSKDEARESYFKAGRHKFVTFRFSRKDKDKVPRIAEQLRKVPGIAQVVAVPEIAPPHGPQAMSGPAAEPYLGENDQVVPISCGPSGCLTNQWYLFRCGVPGAWAQRASGKGVVIADIDWGFDLTHPDLIRTELSLNTITDSSNVSDGNLLFHGNGVLGLAGATINGLGMAGIAHRATLWAIQAGTGAINRPALDHQYWVDAINFVRSMPATGPKIIILELQTAGYSNAESILSINLEIREAIKDGIVVCVPAGNGNYSGDAGRGDPTAPGDPGAPIPDTGSIVVGATRYDPEKNVRGVSNGGPRVTVYAPGDSDSDLTCGIRGRYRDNFGGTSGATAKVAGIIALMLEKNKSLKPAQIRAILASSQTRVFDEQSNDVGVFVDANHAVSEAINMLGAAASTAASTATTPSMQSAKNALQAA